MADPLLPTHLLRRPMILAANVSAVLCGSLLLGIVRVPADLGPGRRGRRRAAGRRGAGRALRLLDLGDHDA